MKTKKYLGVEYRISEGTIEYRPGMILPTYIPEINVEDSASFKNGYGLIKRWVPLMESGFLLKTSYVGRGDDATSVDQLEAIERHTLSKIKQIVEFNELKKQYARFGC
jgi:hypothetical protein